MGRARGVRADTDFGASDSENRSRGIDMSDAARTEPSDAWTEAESPTSNTLFDVVSTTDGPYAVGGEGVVLARGDGNWTAVIEAGPAVKSEELTCAAVTADRKRVWFAGSSGALGMYDVEAGRKYDYTAPEEKTSTWEAMTIAGEGDDARLYVANGSGEVLPVTFDGESCPRYGEVTKPGSGSTITGLESDTERCYAADTSGNVFERTDGEWTRIGIDNAQTNFSDVCATAGWLLVAAGDGKAYRYDHACENWTPVKVGEKSLHAIATTGGQRKSSARTVAVGESGRLYEHRQRDGWVRVSSSLDDSIWGVTLGEVAVAVGNGGTIIERTE